eukprot:gene375-706_t
MDERACLAMTSLEIPHDECSREEVPRAWSDLLLINGFVCGADSKNEPGQKAKNLSDSSNGIPATEEVSAPQSDQSGRGVKRGRRDGDAWDNFDGIPVELTADPPLVNILRLLENSNMLNVCGANSKASERKRSEVLYNDVNDVIHTQTYTYESKILTENVEIRLANGSTVRSRPCFFGRRCQGLSPAIRGHEEHGGAILREYLNPKELDAFNTDGLLPFDRRPCLLCMRSQIHYAYMCLVQSCHHFPNPSIIINGFVNPRNVADGYSEEFMIPREEHPTFQGLAGFVCTSEKHLLSWRHNSSGVREIDQSKLRWDPPELLRVTPEEGTDDYELAQSRILTVIKNHEECCPSHVVHLLYVLLDHYIVSELNRENPKREARIICIETLPNIADCVYRAVLSKEVFGHRNQPLSDGQSVDERIVSAVCHVLSKCVPRACHMRSLITILNRYTHEMPQVLDFFVDIVRCGLLGNFLPNGTHACLPVRRIVYRSATDIRAILVQNFSKNVDDMFLLFCVREYMQATLEHADALRDAIFTLMPAWRTLQALVSTVMNNCRLCSMDQILESNRQNISTDAGRKEMLAYHFRSCNHYMRMTNRNVPRLPLPNTLRVVPPYTTQHVHNVDGSITKRLHNNIHATLSAWKSASDADPISDEWTGAQPEVRLAAVQCQLQQLCTEDFSALALSNDFGARELLRKYTIPVAHMLKNKNVPSLLRLPARVSMQQRRALMNHRALGYMSDTGNADFGDTGTLFICTACGKVKNVMENGSSGLHLAILDSRDGRFYCAEKLCSSRDEVPLLRLELKPVCSNRTFACVIENRVHAICVSCGEVRVMKMHDLLSDVEADRTCAHCANSARDETQGATGFHKKKQKHAPGKGNWFPSCFHCEKKSASSKMKRIKLANPDGPTLPRVVLVCYEHYRHWMSKGDGKDGTIVMHDAEFRDHINRTAKCVQTNTQTYARRKNR